MSEMLNQIITVMKQKYKKDISIYDESFLTKTLEKRLNSLKLNDYNDYLKYIKQSEFEADILSKSLNITFSRFFRDPLTFSILETKILPKLVHQKPEGIELRVWSAGTSTGQEAYSIAILLNEIIGEEYKKCNFRIFATDISGEALDIAKDGIYNYEAIQNVKTKHLHKYFIQSGDSFTILPQLKRNINFSIYDLLDKTSANPSESIYGDFDIVICCNLLFYYNYEKRKSITQKINNSLSTGGYLVTSDTERSFVAETLNLKTYDMTIPVFQNIKR